jgi:hypothetical protein
VPNRCATYEHSLGDASKYLLRGSLPWRMLPPVYTVRQWFDLLRDKVERLAINRTPLMASREERGCKASTGAGLIDGKNMKATESSNPWRLTRKKSGDEQNLSRLISLEISSLSLHQLRHRVFAQMARCQLLAQSRAFDGDISRITRLPN